MSRALFPALLLLAPAFVPAAEPAGSAPDPKSVRREGAGFRYAQAGWVVLHIEGEPYQRGYQHGKLLAAEIADEVKALAAQYGPKAPEEAWGHARTLVNALFLRKFDREVLEEMKGIADGAAEAGAKYDDRPIDLVDIAAVNLWMEIESLDSALDATPTGAENLKPAKPAPPAKKPDHCSAFIATGPATADGKIVLGHVTWAGLMSGPFVNVWVEVVPKAGHRFVMQAFPGGVWSSQDYYINDAGVLLAETTIDQTPFDASGVPLVCRARKAIQYGESIDDVVRVLTEKNNGLYANEWLIGDLKTNEVALYEMGTRKAKLRRSSKNEWFGDTLGFFWGCNHAKDPGVRTESSKIGAEKPVDPEWKPSDRDEAWLKAYKESAGKIDADFAKKVYSAGPLPGDSSLDAKVTTAALAAKLATHAMYGPPTGKVWEPTPEDREKFGPLIKPLRPHPWTVLTAGPPPKGP